MISAKSNDIHFAFEIAGRLFIILGPFSSPPFINLRINPVGLVPNKTGGWRLITNLSFPARNSLNDYIDSDLKHVKYSSPDNTVNIVQKKLAKTPLWLKLVFLQFLRYVPYGQGILIY